MVHLHPLPLGLSIDHVHFDAAYCYIQTVYHGRFVSVSVLVILVSLAKWLNRSRCRLDCGLMRPREPSLRSVSYTHLTLPTNREV